MEQPTFSDLEYPGKKRKTRQEHLAVNRVRQVPALTNNFPLWG